ncbi:MAG: hypothetical protein QXD25_00070 [Nanopusillaceae archaeon]
MSWKKNLDPIIRDFLNTLLREVEEYKDSYLKAEDPATAQIWTALAIIYRKLSYIESEIHKIHEKIKENELKNKLEESLKKL